MNGMLELETVLRKLRKDCPWDREQTPQSLTPYILEESYELVDAIRHEGPDKVREELGDFAMQFILQAIIAEERGEFTLNEVGIHAARKLVARHPHVYGENAARDAAEVEQNWEARKNRERAAAGEPYYAHLPRALPALSRARKIGKKAAEVGFDWPEAAQVVDKIREEIQELAEAPPDQRAEEFGDLLFALVNYGRKLGLDPEDCLQKANDKFIRRFHGVQAGLRAQGRELAESTLEEMEAHWQKVKISEVAD